jgi:hypothetical protein
MEETTPPASQPSVVELDIVKLREQAWITGLVIIIELSYVFIIYLPALYFYCLWGFIVYLISSLFLLKKDIEEFHRFSVYGLLMFNTWYVYGLLPWGNNTSSILKAIIQLLTIAVSIFYVLTRNQVFVSMQIGLLCVPISLSVQLSSAELGIITVAYFTGWYLLTGVAFYLNKEAEPLFVYIAVLPILRTINILFVFYVIVLCTATAVRLYPVGKFMDKEEEIEEIEVKEDPPTPPPTPQPTPIQQPPAQPVIRPYRPYRDTTYKPPKPKPPPVEISKNLKVKSIYSKNENDEM